MMRTPNVEALIGKKLADVERALIEATLAHCQQDKRRTARMLGVSRRTIYNKLERYGSLGAPG